MTYRRFQPAGYRVNIFFTYQSAATHWRNDGFAEWSNTFVGRLAFLPGFSLRSARYAPQIRK
jgi:hypothetical protein